ncbi:conserved protein of unknown function (plasmid) [Pseudodesulfovibrio profundus]|uniref:Glycosyltransferase family 1 protein n=1 Tax=Pseudodesulfovibrio profundus TaxID=57320 RepID=A0A2C8FGL0_9BACT|nr:glycosyltransferase family 1 protein [Pseudodesulfovibrio profundus]SOB62128.1 conserved protein of unknown function [Pseudodesulfovibrio profundus]
MTVTVKKLVARLWPASFERLPGKVGPFTFSSTDNLVVLHFGDTPTLDYYWKTRFPTALYIDTACEKSDAELLNNASAIVLVRHISPVWQKMLLAESNSLPPVLVFFDDDIPGILNDPHIPFVYSLKTAIRYARALKIFDKICSSVYVSSDGLAVKYGLDDQSVLGPLPVEPTGSVLSQNDGPVTIFYHGTASHRREILWLRDVIAEVVKRQPGVLFELFGEKPVSKLYQGIEGVRVVHPMKWQPFLTYSASVSYDIGLAPLLDSPFNRCRSHVKYYDITRASGVGIYSENSVFHTVIKSGENGLLVKNSVQDWVDAICGLVQNGNMRRRMFENASAHIVDLRETSGARG